MLVYFSAKNYLSIHEPVELYLIPSEHARIKGTRYEAGFHVTHKYKLMRSALLFGPNGSGKTNLLCAIRRMQDIILTGLVLPGRAAFSFPEPVSFTITVLDETGHREYEYAISYDAQGLVEEHLYVDMETAYEYKKGQLTWNQPGDVPVVTAATDILAQVAPVLPEAVCLRQTVAKISIFIDEAQAGLALTEEAAACWRSRPQAVTGLLQLADSAIDGVSVSPATGEALLHRHGTVQPCSLSLESSGVRKMAALSPALLRAFDRGVTLLVDQLDRDWPTPVLQKLFRQYVHNEANQGQIIGTVHDLLLLDNLLFQPEQLFLLRRDEQQQTRLWSVGDYRLRSEKRRLYDAYLKGAFDRPPA